MFLFQKADFGIVIVAGSKEILEAEINCGAPVLL